MIEIRRCLFLILENYTCSPKLPHRILQFTGIDRTRIVAIKLPEDSLPILYILPYTSKLCGKNIKEKNLGKMGKTNFVEPNGATSVLVLKTGRVRIKMGNRSFVQISS
jgi:hypothetical protein